LQRKRRGLVSGPHDQIGLTQQENKQRIKCNKYWTKTFFERYIISCIKQPRQKLNLNSFFKVCLYKTNNCIPDIFHFLCVHIWPLTRSLIVFVCILLMTSFTAKRQTSDIYTVHLVMIKRNAPFRKNIHTTIRSECHQL